MLPSLSLGSMCDDRDSLPVTSASEQEILVAIPDLYAFTCNEHYTTHNQRLGGRKRCRMTTP